MKKSLLALAALSAFATAAQAQSSVSVYGLLDMGYSDVSTKDTAGDTTDTKGINSGAGLSSSRLGFKGAEDLGGGLKAGFTYELGLTPENSTSTHATRAALLSLSSNSMGSLSFGRGNTLGKNTNDGFTAFGGGGSFEQGAVTLEVTRGSALGTVGSTKNDAVETKPAFDRASNQVTYVSPKFSGFTVAAQLIAKSVDADDLDGATESSGTAFQLAYAGNGFTAAYTRTSLDLDTQEVEGKTGLLGDANTAPVIGVKAAGEKNKEITADQFGVTYKMGAVKVFGLYNNAEYKSSPTAVAAKNKGYDIGATYTIGKTTLLASFGDGEMKSSTGAVTDVSGMQAQVHYALSKRTTAYALYGTTEYKGATKGESDVTMIGVRHKF
jgi:predicted porin